MARVRYGEGRREEFLAAWELNGRNTRRTCRQLSIPKSTAIGWIRRLVGDENQPTREQAREELTRKCWLRAAQFLDIMLAKAQQDSESLHAVCGAFIKAVEHAMNLEYGRLHPAGAEARAGANILVGVKSEQSVSLSGLPTEQLNARLAELLGRLGQGGAAADPRGARAATVPGVSPFEPR